jgi:transposase
MNNNRYYFCKKKLQDFDIHILDTLSPELKALILFLLEKVEPLSIEVSELKIENAELKIENAELKIENAELKSRLNQNSSNSSRPPSSDSYRKIIKNGYKEPTKPQGGQRGHTGNTLKQVETPDEIIKCSPKTCNCGHEFCGNEEKVNQTIRQVFEIPQPKMHVIEYQVFDYKCPICGEIHSGNAPIGVNAPVQYGNMVKSLVVFMNNELKLPLNKIRLFFKNTFGNEINESTITTILSDCYSKLEATETKIKEELTLSSVCHADETGIRIENKLNWLHVFSTSLYTYLFAHSKRGKEAVESEQSIIPNFKNWLVHDCWASYFNFDKSKHALCNAHIIRELQAVIDNDINGNAQWAKDMQNYLIKLLNMDFEDRIKNKISLDQEYYKICKLGLIAEPLPEKIKNKRGRAKKSKARNLLCRLIKYKKNILAFAYNENVPFTNNQAERDLRPAKIKLKISNSFRSNSGANAYARIQSFISTAKKNGKNIITEIYNTFNGYNFITNAEAS